MVMTGKSSKLTTASCVTIMMGAMIGSAIFSLSGVTYAMAGPSHIITWVIAAAILLVYGLIAAELACIYPVSGGLYVYPRELLGKTRAVKEFWGWTSAWAFLNTGIFGAAFSAIYVPTYLGGIWPVANEHVLAVTVLACIICGLMNVFNISLVGKINLMLVTFMSIVLVVYAACGFTALYLVVIVATTGMIETADFTNDPSLQYYPLYAAIGKALPGMGWLGLFVSIAALLALFTTLLVLIMSVANTVAAAAQTGFLPSFLGKYNKNTKTPIASIILSTVVVTIVACFPQFVAEISSTGAVAMVVTVALLAYTLLVARKQLKSSEDHFRLPGGKVLPAAIVIILIAFLAMQQLKSIILCGVWFALGFIIYAIVIGRK